MGIDYLDGTGIWFATLFKNKKEHQNRSSLTSLFNMHELRMISFGEWVKLVMIIAHVISIYGFIDLSRSKFKDLEIKLFWILVLLLIPALGTILYIRFAKYGKMATNEINNQQNQVNHI